MRKPCPKETVQKRIVDEIVADIFREVYKSRQEVMAQWEAAVRLLSKRDAEIEGVALEIERYICTTKVMTLT